MCGKVLAVPCCTQESCCTLLCSPRVALKILVYEHAQTTLMHLYGASKSPWDAEVCEKKLFLSLVLWVSLSVLLAL